MNQAVLLLAHGAPERLEDLGQYLENVRGGRPASPGLLEEIRSRYAQIGGGSPLLALTRRQAAALEAVLGLPVYFGMRNWSPYIRETLARLKEDGVERIVALCLAPQYSKLSVGLYFRRVQEAMDALGWSAEVLWTPDFHDDPLLAKAFAEKLTPLLPAGRVLFTAHSLPEKILAEGDPYDAQAKATARAVAECAGLEASDFAYQSQGMTEDKWLGPTVESCLERYASEGVQDVLLVPVGFVCDHVEILYDVDIHFREHAEKLGIRLRRTGSLNDSPAFIAALAAVVRRRLEAS